MSTDFFAHQDAARRQTGRLVALFVLSVCAIVASLYGLAVGVAAYLGADPRGGGRRLRFSCSIIRRSMARSTVSSTTSGSKGLVM